MSSSNWVVTTSGEKPLREVAKALERKGFEVAQVLEEVGCITGSASNEVAQEVRAVAGVADVAPEQPIDIGPPDAPVTW